MIDEEKSYWKQESVGTIFFHLYKTDRIVWQQLTREYKKVKIWTDFEGEAMDEFYELMEEMHDL